jgi:catechol 2,3-dioxygenase-like lactoylglutathione lyase family enzyme
MDRAVAFHRDTLGLALKFSSPFWTEFDTGATTLGLHAADGDHPAGSVQLGLGVDDLPPSTRRARKGLAFTKAPESRFGATIARFLDSEGAETSISG